jgi:hypothetical protein
VRTCTDRSNATDDGINQLYVILVRLQNFHQISGPLK